MHIYEWNGPEESLGMPLITTRRMMIQEINTHDAKGSIWVRDHVEGIEVEDPWIANETLSPDSASRWEVRRYVGPGRFAFTDRESGEPLFGLLDAANRAIKTFISIKLTEIVPYMLKNPRKPVDLSDEPARYSGQKHEYVGTCLCAQIGASNKSIPFDWEGQTNKGNYPANCFQCSCGMKWYRGNPTEERWVEVADDLAWSMFMDFDGVAMEYIAIDPEAKKPQLVLLRTLRSRGLIPIG
ncbi:hypothetical protein EXS57_01915 [Candidatus Kaiserbacteria bacterium]|nr:hypothetical protein [Candidatus Kaiserbacteria bacterium]